MKARLITIMLLQLMIMHTHGQNVPLNFSTEEINGFTQSLHKSIDDTTRIDVLLRLASYHLQKEGNEKISIDSAVSFIKLATAVNQRSRKRDGPILLAESSVARERGDITSGKQLLEKAIPLLQGPTDEFYLAMAFLEYCYYYEGWNKTDTAELTAALNKLFLQSKKIKDHARKTEYSRALTNHYRSRLNSALKPTKLFFLDHFILLYRELGYKEYELWARKEVADLHFQQNEMAIAMSELLQLAKEHKSGNYPGICFTYDLLAAVYLYATDFEKALYYALETIKSVNSAFDSTYLPNFYVRIANIYDHLFKYQESLNWNMQRFNYTVATNELHEIYYTITQISEDLSLLGRPKEGLDFILKQKKKFVPANIAEEVRLATGLSRIYHALGNDLMAEKYNQELIRLTQSPINEKEVTFDLGIYVYLTNFYLRTGEYNKAEIYYKKSLPEWEKGAKNSPRFWTFQHSVLFKLDSVRGNYPLAIRHLQEGQRINDSIYNAIKSRQIEQLRISYDVDQKDKLLALNKENIQLLTEQHDLQKSKLRQGAILRNISFAVVALLIVIVTLLFNRYRLKQRTNRQLELHQNEIAKQNLSLHHLVKEKDWLVKEIHHRVKNNLQIVMSLLNSQSAYIDNEPALTAIHDSQHRVHAMSLIHQKLYNSENLSSINMSIYVRELVSYLSESFVTGQRIRFELSVEPLELDVSQAVPVGLILNEAITNSIKYAFPDEMKGLVTISLSNTSLHKYLLTISDDGIGIPIHVKDKKPGSLGMSLIAGLSEDLDGTFSIENNNGTVIRISFVDDQRIHAQNTLTTSFISTN